MLITGGLLALGILSMLSAILLARGGSSAKSTPEVRVGRTLVEPASTSPAAIAAPITQREVIERAGEAQMSEQFLRMNEQFRELADRLEVIHERSIAIEQRLERLSIQVERIEKAHPCER